MKILALILVAFSLGCTLGTEDEMQFTFPDTSRDSIDANGVWHGTRAYTGKYGVRIKYTEGACVGLIKAHQNNDFIPGTKIPIEGSGVLTLSAQGPCTGAYDVTVIEAE